MIKSSKILGKSSFKDVISTVIPNIKQANLKKVDDLQKKLIRLDEILLSSTYKFGVLYYKAGQQDENEVFGNESGSEEFNEFLSILGQRIQLKGFTGFSGGLDVKSKL